MFGEVSWVSPSRSNKFVRISFNGGRVSYDKAGLGLKSVPEPKRWAAINAEIEFTEKLEEIFKGDPEVEEYLS